MNVCRECKQAISEGASKCHNCGAYQNWKRFIGSASLLAGFMLTWVSIWAAPPVKEILQDKRADLKVSILEGDYKEITFMLSNVGNQPAGLSQIEISADTKHGSASWYFNSDFDKKLIEPAKAYIIKASHNGITPIPEHIKHEFQYFYRSRLGEPLKNGCDLVIQYVQLNGTKEYLYYPFPCNVITPIDKIKEEQK